jgi:hypothetical protein
VVSPSPLYPRLSSIWHYKQQCFMPAVACVANFLYQSFLHPMCRAVQCVRSQTLSNLSSNDCIIVTYEQKSKVLRGVRCCIRMQRTVLTMHTAGIISSLRLTQLCSPVCSRRQYNGSGGVNVGHDLALFGSGFARNFHMCFAALPSMPRLPIKLIMRIRELSRPSALIECPHYAAAR